LKPIRYLQKDSVAKYFNRTANVYNDWYSDNSWLGYAFIIRKRRVLEFFDKPGGKVLDVGCGPGIMAKDLREQQCKFWGIDLSSEMINQGRELYKDFKDVDLQTGTAEELPFPDENFDCTMSMGVIEFVDDDQKALREIVRVTKQDGTIILAFMNKYSAFRLWRDFVFYPLTSWARPIMYRLTKRARKPHIHQRTYSEQSIRDFLKSENCEFLDVVYCNFNIFLAPLEHLFPRLSVMVAKKLEKLGRSKLKNLGTAFVVKARKK